MLGIVLFLAALVTGGNVDQLVPASAPAFDQPINPDLYLIRPGDKLTVTFVKAKIMPLILTVDAEGRIVQEDIGILDLSRASLTEGKRSLKDALAKVYKVDQIAVSITEPREVSVSVTGAVAQPGVYAGFTSQRVSDILAAAGGITAAGSRRRIVFSGGPGDIRVDLDRAIISGESDYNPYLYAGRHIHVPNKSQDIVQVVGAVNGPRDVELVEGDDLSSIIRLAGGTTFEADTSGIRIASAGGDKRRLKAGDIIVVPTKPDEAAMARVALFGAVKNPGLHSFSPGTNLKDLLSLGGDFLPEAAVEQTTVFRRADTDEWGNPTNTSYPIGNVVSAAGAVTPFAIRPRDSVFVPLRTGYVKVSGEVLNPGLFPFLSGKSALYYITAAGGFTAGADRNRVFKFNRVARTTEDLSPEVLVQDGEAVTVGKREAMK